MLTLTHLLILITFCISLVSLRKALDANEKADRALKYLKQKHDEEIY